MKVSFLTNCNYKELNLCQKEHLEVREMINRARLPPCQALHPVSQAALSRHVVGGGLHNRKLNCIKYILTPRCLHTYIHIFKLFSHYLTTLKMHIAPFLISNKPINSKDNILRGQRNPNEVHLEIYTQAMMVAGGQVKGRRA